MSDMRSLGFSEVSPEKLDFNPFEKIGTQWMLVTAGDESGFNTMTASWGFAGVMWGKSAAITAIRPQRYTKEFIDKSEYFTLSFFDEKYRSALALCGRVSGRDTDKVKDAGLTPVFLDGTASFEQAELVLVCRKLYADPLRAEAFADASLIGANYAAGDYHTMYIGEIVKAYKR